MQTAGQKKSPGSPGLFPKLYLYTAACRSVAFAQPAQPVLHLPAGRLAPAQTEG